MRGLVAKQIGKMNGRASPGLDCVAAPLIKYAAVVRPQVNGRGTEQVNVLVPYIARLFKLFYEKARIPDCWKKAKLTPLYKKGPLIEPNSYRMLAVSGTMYCLYANVVCSLVTDWHLQHAARIIKPGRSSQLHTAFIDSKQAYDTIPRQALWQHLQRTYMPTSFSSIINYMYDADEYNLKDGEKNAQRGCK
eukprot:1161196-Pelagomonas_calceolata.AAC.3